MGRHRIVASVEWAREIPRPTCIPKARNLRGSKGIGLSYEKRFAEVAQKCLPGARHGQWFEYLADGRRGYCQPDVIVPFTGVLLVLECKLRNVEQAEAQLVQLYLPVLRACYNQQVRAIVVTKSLSALPSGSLVARNLLEAIQMTKTGEMPVLHWLGRGPL